MRLEIKNLGPIVDSKIDLEDITVLLGPPNSGKSYTLRALYSTLVILDHIVLQRIMEELIEEIFLDVVENISNNLREIVPIILNAIDSSQNSQYVDFPEELARNMGMSSKNYTYRIFEEDNTAILSIGDRYSISRGELLNELNQKLESMKGELLPIALDTKLYLNASLPDKLFVIQNVLYRVLDGYEYIGRQAYSRYPSRYLRLKDFRIRILEENGSLNIIFKVTIRLNMKYLEHFRNSASSIKRDPVLARLFRDLDSIRLDIDRQLERELEVRLSKRIGEYIDATTENFDIRSVSFIPFGRTPLVYSSIESGLFMLPDNLLFESYMANIETGIKMLSRGQFNKDVVKMFSPVLQGEIRYDKSAKNIRYQKWGAPDLPIEFSSALASEVSGILLPILNAPPNSCIIIEEPEAQLHYSTQIIMALTLIALSNRFGHKIIFSTHSDIFAITLAFLKELRYHERDIIRLVRELLKLQGVPEESIEDDKIMPLAQAISSKRDFTIHFYYYNPTPSGVEIIPKKVNEIMEDVPGITVVTDILYYWAMNLSRR